MDIKKNIEIVGVGSQLQGVGRSDCGRTLFVPFAIPGEVVDVRITKSQKNFLEGEIIEIKAPHSQRTQPACPYYGTCGGCAAMHMRYELTLELKRVKVESALTRLGKIENPNVQQTIPSEKTTRYRNKAEYAVRAGHFGMMAKNSNRVVGIDDCLLQDVRSVALMNAAKEVFADAPQLKGIVTRVNDKGGMMVIYAAEPQSRIPDLHAKAGALNDLLPELKSSYWCALQQKPHHALDGLCRMLTGSETLSERFFGFDYALSPQSFFQVNRAQAENLVQILLDGLDLQGDESVLELFSGIGTLSLPIAKQAKSVTGVEIVRPAVENARAAAEANGVENATFALGDAGEYLLREMKAGRRYEVIVVDPPRAGIGEDLARTIAACKPQKIGYVSCDCATLARDAKVLCENGYELVSATPLDMFPWTEHVETVCILQRNANRRG